MTQQHLSHLSSQTLQIWLLWLTSEVCWTSGNSLLCSSTCCDMQWFLDSLLIRQIINQPFLLLWKGRCQRVQQICMPQHNFMWQPTLTSLWFPDNTIWAVVTYEYLGSFSSAFSWEQDTTSVQLTLSIVYCVLCEYKEAVYRNESQGEESIPLLPALSVTFLTNPAISGDLVFYSVSLFPTQSNTVTCILFNPSSLTIYQTYTSHHRPR